MCTQCSALTTNWDGLHCVHSEKFSFNCSVMRWFIFEYTVKLFKNCFYNDKSPFCGAIGTVLDCS